MTKKESILLDHKTTNNVFKQRAPQRQLDLQFRALDLEFRDLDLVQRFRFRVQRYSDRA